MTQEGNKVVLVILDGFGLSPVEQGNAILRARTPFFEFAMTHYSFASLQASGESVGLPWGEMGNSEVGHITLGAGRVVLQDYPQISRTIQSGEFFKHPAFAKSITHLKKNKGRLHLLGLASNGGVHGHIDHLTALIDWAASSSIGDVAIHLIADGRDAPPRSLPKFIDQIQTKLTQKPIGRIASICGRYFAMDRDKRWDRTEQAYRLLVDGVGGAAPDVTTAIKHSYDKGKSDEFIEPVAIGGAAPLRDGDLVIFTNYRPDRAIQLTKALADPKFDAFKVTPLKNLKLVTMTNYEDTNLPVEVLFSSVDLANPKTNPLTHPLSEVVASAGLNQLHIAETEKYAHVTYFFNNGFTEPFSNESQILVPSPKVATYDSKPEMAAPAIVEQFTKRFRTLNPSLTVINFANADMVGHTGDLRATILAVETLDRLLAVLTDEIISPGGYLLITADHGNAEQMIDLETGEPDKEHTISPVPLLIIKPTHPKPTEAKRLMIKEKSTLFATEPVGLLADVAPTVLQIIGLTQPAEMTGTSLLAMI